MATIPKPKYVSLDDNQVSISNYTTTDKDIHSYFANLSESDDMDEKFEHALKIGVVAANAVNTTHDLHIVENKFNVLDSSFHKTMDEIFGDNGRFSKLIAEHFGEDGQLLKDFLNPHKEGSPLQLTVKEFTARIEELKNLVSKNKGREEEAERGTQKGTEFEHYCDPLLQKIAQIHGDSVTWTANDPGIITDCDKGDFVYDIKELNKRIVWEAKNYGTKLSETKINEYLDLAIENREGDYGILVSRNVEALKDDIGWFKELTDKKLVIALGTKTNDPELHHEILHIAYRWARAKLLQDTLRNGGFDPTFVKDKITVLQEKLKALSSIQKQCENIDTASAGIKVLAATLDEEFDKEFEEILDSLK